MLMAISIVSFYSSWSMTKGKVIISAQQSKFENRLKYCYQLNFNLNNSDFNVVDFNSGGHFVCGLCNPLQTCSYWYSYKDTGELTAGASVRVYHCLRRYTLILKWLRQFFGRNFYIFLPIWLKFCMLIAEVNI